MPVVIQINDTNFDGVPAYAMDEEGEEDPNVLHGYTYEEYDSGTEIVRVFDSHDLAPDVIQNFCKPAGYVFSVSMVQERLPEIFDQLEFCNINYSYLNYSLNYTTFGTEVYVESFNNWFEKTIDDYANEDEYHAAAREFYSGYIMNNLKNLFLFKVEEVTVQTDLMVLFDIMFVDKEDNWHRFKFYGETILIEPYDENAFVVPNLYCEDNGMGDNRISVTALLTNGFFNEYPHYNPYGFQTDTMIDIYVYDEESGEVKTEHIADCTITLLAFNSIPLGSFANEQGLDLTIPKENIIATLKLEFVSGGKQYAFYSKQFFLGNPNLTIHIDNDVTRDSVERNSSHLFTLNSETIDYENIQILNAYVSAFPSRLNDGLYGCELFDKTLPEKGEVNKYYYIPSDREIELHNQGKDEEYINNLAEGQYYVWDETTQEFKAFDGVTILESSYNSDDGEFDLEKYTSAYAKLPFVGKWFYMINFTAWSDLGSWHISAQSQEFEVVNPHTTEDIISLNVPDNVNLLVNAGDIEIIPSISSYNAENSYYYNWTISRDGVIEIEEGENGKLTVKPINSGLVDLTIEIESNVFSKISKTVSVRVLDTIYDVSKIQVPDGFHSVGKDLTLALSVRGFTDIQNVTIDWTIVDKEGVELPKEQMVIHDNATMTIIDPQYDDYTITASYQGIELDKVTIKFRYVDMNKFLKMNIWWIVLITFGFVALIIFILTMTKRGKTTVQRIERVYQVFCQCLSNDSLSKEELQRIKREITRCLHHCEDLNIDAFNQYEKATRYLRKSLIDTKTLLTKYDALSVEEKNVMYTQLDKDLSKALNVAKEIENAKDLIEAYHNQANRQNFEEIKKEKPKK